MKGKELFEHNEAQKKIDDEKHLMESVDKLEQKIRELHITDGVRNKIGKLRTSDFDSCGRAPMHMLGRTGPLEAYWNSTAKIGEETWSVRTTKFLSSLMELDEGESLEFGWANSKRAVLYRHTEMGFQGKRVSEEDTIVSVHELPKKTWRDVFK